MKLWQKFTHPKMYKETTGDEAVISQRDVDLLPIQEIPMYFDNAEDENGTAQDA